MERHYLEYTDDRSNKFWEIILDGCSTTVTYGKIGFKGKSQEKTHSNPEDANAFFQEMLNSKIKKGYVYPTNNKPNAETLEIEQEPLLTPLSIPTLPTPFESTVDWAERFAPRTLVELNLCRLSAQIREKDKWWEKVNDQNILQKWKKELLDQSIPESHLEYVLSELSQRYLKIRNSFKQLGIETSTVDGVWQSQDPTFISEEIKQELIRSILPLEDIPTHQIDYHPGSNQKVINLIHPSLYCFVYGVTKTLESSERSKSPTDLLNKIGSGKVIEPTALSKEKRYYSSGRFQWLPTDLRVDENGNVKLLSYINNLHPKDFEPLYQTLEKILSKFIPLFNQVLSDMLKDFPLRVQVDLHKISDKIESDKEKALGNPPYEYDYEDNEDYSEESDEESELDDEETEDEDDHDKKLEEYNNRLDRWLEENAKNYQPKPPKNFKPISPNPKIDLRNRNLQVVFKIAKIQLTPDQPKYEGGAWHVEGMKNENIVATGIYYFSSENISESRIQFRTDVAPPDYQQNDQYGPGIIYGLYDDDPLNQPRGSVLTRENLCLCWPNTYQHRVDPFELKDPMQPGFRKILVFFLIDPNTEILSTGVVPPQQQSWITEAPIKPKKPQSAFRKLFSRFKEPESVGMTLMEAQKFREMLMDERRQFYKANNSEWFERAFSLCEH